MTYRATHWVASPDAKKHHILDLGNVDEVTGNFLLARKELQLPPFVAEMVLSWMDAGESVTVTFGIQASNGDAECAWREEQRIVFSERHWRRSRFHKHRVRMRRRWWRVQRSE